jgi:hypothetical protein
MKVSSSTSVCAACDGFEHGGKERLAVFQQLEVVAVRPAAAVVHGGRA